MSEANSLVTSEGQDTFLSMGMPGSLNFRGLTSVKVKVKSNTMMDYVYKNQSNLCKFDLETDKPSYPGYCSNLWDKYSYLGMSNVLITRYLSKDKLHVVATGAPREDLYGVVHLFTLMYDVSFGPVMKHLNQTLRGHQRGSYFGFSLAACDLNGDKSADLIVGAPYYSKSKYEPNAGAVYIYINHKTRGFTNEYVFNYTGRVRSLFGNSIASIGDIDKDGLTDFAVGAPFETNSDHNDETKSLSSTGAVYIFRGSTIPEKIKLSQKIFASMLRPPAGMLTGSSLPLLRGFGYSLSGGLDMDNNKYPDLLVGALNSNAVLVLRTKPIVNLNAYLSNSESLQEIDGYKKSCSLNDQTNAACFHLDVCFKLVEPTMYNQLLESNAYRHPIFVYQLEAEMNTTSSKKKRDGSFADTDELDSLSNVDTPSTIKPASNPGSSMPGVSTQPISASPVATYSRVYFNQTGTNYLNGSFKFNAASTNGEYCSRFHVLIKNENFDFLSPIKFYLSYDIEDEQPNQRAINLEEINNHPIVHQDLNKHTFEVRNL
jgi:hypothetical protein